MVFFLQCVLSGLSAGAVYGLAALGFVLIYKTTGILNLAQGALILLGGYLFSSLAAQLGLPIWLAIVASILIMGIVGYSLERFPLRPMLGQPHLSIVMVTLALYIFFGAIVTSIWGEFAVMPTPYFLPSKTMSIGGIVITSNLLWSFIIGGGITAAFVIFFQFSRVGLNMRAVAEGHQIVRSMGISVSAIIALVWAMATIIGTCGGILSSQIRGADYGLVDYGLKAIGGAILGGMDSIHGAIIGCLIVGVLETLAGGYIGYGIKEAFPYIVLVLAIVIKPYGLFGLERIERI
ncbi:MAG: branched-chain amino acid ABC transporter permease [Chloroflexi bacterium]|nr:branched-chain amino acid ABC transporter permease [Chloroflexota bacterium]